MLDQADGFEPGDKSLADAVAHRQLFLLARRAHQDSHQPAVELNLQGLFHDHKALGRLAPPAVQAQKPAPFQCWGNSFHIIHRTFDPPFRGHRFQAFRRRASTGQVSAHAGGQDIHAGPYQQA